MKLFQDEAKRRKVNPATDTEESIWHKYNASVASNYIKGKKVLDIGCWSGQMEYFLPNTPELLVGIDPNTEAINLAKRRIPQFQFKVARAEKLPFANNYFDTVLMFEVLEHLPVNSEPQVFVEINRVLKKGGILIMSTPNKTPLAILLDPAYFLINHRHYSKDELTKFITDSNLAIKNFSTKWGYFSAFYSNLSLFYKHILKSRFKCSVWLHKKLMSEYQNPGQLGLYLICRKE